MLFFKNPMPFWVVVLCIYLLFLCKHVESFLCPHHPILTPILRYLMSLVWDLFMVLWYKSGCFFISGLRLSWVCLSPSTFPLPKCCCWWLLYYPPLCGLFCFSQFAILTVWRESSMVPRLGTEGVLLPSGESRLDSSPATPWDLALHFWLPPPTVLSKQLLLSSVQLAGQIPSGQINDLSVKCKEFEKITVNPKTI